MATASGKEASGAGPQSSPPKKQWAVPEAYEDDYSRVTHDMEDEDTGMVWGEQKHRQKSKGRGRGKAAYPKGGENTPASAYTGHKIKHLKKDDGEPLWRKDIQYDFLREIFTDETACFTNSYEPEREMQTFADLYIDTMARSSKTSKILRDKLLSEHEPAKNMAMVCLLVNLGRMNTTLNFFPEMRAQLRTYHAIPSLQAHQDPNSYKQLQDAPRLKSILKGASEDRLEPNTLEKIKDREIPRTNPVNLIFVLAQYSQRITELHFPPESDFYDLIMRTNLSSKSRGKAFLWLMWHYLQSDFTEEGCAENPFGAGIDYGTGVSNQGVPEMKQLSPQEEQLENVDTREEIDFGETKMKERKRIIEADQLAAPEIGPPKRGPKPRLNLAALEAGESPLPLAKTRISKYDTDNDSTRSTPPRGAISARKGVTKGTPLHGPTPIKRALESSPAPSGSVTHEHPARRTRPLTAHQLAVEQSRNDQVNHILNRGLQKAYHNARKVRKIEGAILRAVHRTAQLGQAMCEDSEDEENLRKPNNTPFRERGLGGLVQLRAEQDDYGEEMMAYGTALKRLGRRLDRLDGKYGWVYQYGGKVVDGKTILDEKWTKRREEWEEEDNRKRIKFGMEPRFKKESPPLPSVVANVENREEEDEEAKEEDLDDVDKTLLGLDEEEGREPEEDLDDVDKALLGLDGDETDEETRMDVD